MTSYMWHATPVTCDHEVLIITHGDLLKHLAGFEGDGTLNMGKIPGIVHLGIQIMTKWTLVSNAQSTDQYSISALLHLLERRMNPFLSKNMANAFYNLYKKTKYVILPFPSLHIASYCSVLLQNHKNLNNNWKTHMAREPCHP